MRSMNICLRASLSSATEHLLPMYVFMRSFGSTSRWSLQWFFPQRRKTPIKLGLCSLALVSHHQVLKPFSSNLWLGSGVTLVHLQYCTYWRTWGDIFIIFRPTPPPCHCIQLNNRKLFSLNVDKGRRRSIFAFEFASTFTLTYFGSRDYRNVPRVLLLIILSYLGISDYRNIPRFWWLI